MTTKANTQAYRKTAISVPAKLLAQVDRAAHARGESRSQFIQRLLKEAVAAQNDIDFTERLNAFLAIPSQRAAFNREAKKFKQITPAWSYERW